MIKPEVIDSMKHTIKLFALLLISVVVISACTLKQNSDVSSSTKLEKREFHPVLDGRWIGNGISYSPYRDGEHPDMETLIARENILQDLQILAKRWNLIRLYGADAQHQRVIEVIRDNQLPIRVMQGAWISGHQTGEQNQQQVDQLIEMANQFPDIIVAVNVGNEIFVDWSWHKVKDMDKVIEYIRQVRSEISQPVTVNDDYNFWNKPHAKKIADEVDFIGLHAYAFWNNKTLDVALDWTVDIYNDIQRRFPEHVIAYTETGWPTSRVYDDSYEGGLIGKAGEDQQQQFFEQYDAWVDANRIVSLYFSAFDEKWKGGFDGDNPMAKAEKHWGVYRSDRTPKKLLQ